jgi:hypothetical protein
VPVGTQDDRGGAVSTERSPTWRDALEVRVVGDDAEHDRSLQHRAHLEHPGTFVLDILGLSRCCTGDLLVEAAPP